MITGVVGIVRNRMKSGEPAPPTKENDGKRGGSAAVVAVGDKLPTPTRDNSGGVRGGGRGTGIGRLGGPQIVGEDQRHFFRGGAGR